MNIFLFIGLILITTLYLGKLLERIRVPWIFAALLIGVGLAIPNPTPRLLNAASFQLFAQLGMYLLLFLIGFELDLVKLKARSRFIFVSTLLIILLEGFLGALVVRFVFGYPWEIAFLVALSFATVGEAILVPILQEFRLVNTPLGQSIIGIGTADDIIEILLLLFATFLVGSQVQPGGSGLLLLALGMLAALTLVFSHLGQDKTRFVFPSIETLFLFVLFIFFIFVGVGEYASSAPMGAILAGMSVRFLIRSEHLELIEKELKSITYGFFAPLFFVWVGSELNISYLLAYPLLVLLVVVVSNGAKLLGSYLVGQKELGTHGSILLGIGLSVRFSTSILIIKFLFDNHIIGADIYSVIVASSIIFKFIVPLAFARLAARWGFTA